MSAPLAPQNLDAEAYVLGAMMLGGDVARVRGLVDVDDFYRDSHRATFQTILRLYDRRAPVEAPAVIAELSRAGDLERVAGADRYVVGLVARVARPARTRPTTPRSSTAAQ